MVLTAALGTMAGGAMVNSLASSAGAKNSGTFFVTINPSSLTIGQSASARSIVTVTSINSFAGTVALSLFFPGGKLPALLSPTSVSLSANATAKSTLTVTTTNTTSTGSYSIVVIGVSSGHGKTSYSSTMLSVQVVSNRDFTITVSPTSITNLVGSTNTTKILLASQDGFNGTITLTATLPFGYITITGGQSPVTLAAGGTATSTLQITTSTSTLPGTYTVTITGTSGPISHTTTVTLTASDPTPLPPESLKLVNYSFSSNTNVTLSIQNTGTTSVTLQSYSVRDSTGDAWTLANWSGPTIAPSSVIQVNVLISTSCGGCIYTGILGLFTQFVPGQTYTIVVTTTRNNQFSFTVTR